MGLFRTKEEKFLALACDWLSADGLNGKDDVLELLSECSDGALTEDCADAWFNGDVDKAALKIAFATIREDPGCHFGWDVLP